MCDGYEGVCQCACDMDVFMMCINVCEVCVYVCVCVMGMKVCKAMSVHVMWMFV